MTLRKLIPCLVCAGLWTGVACAQGAEANHDWPQFRGPNGDGLCAETGLLKDWSAGGPKLLWKATGLGMGYSTVAIAEGKIFTLGDLDRRGAKAQHVIALDLTTHNEVWATAIGPPHSGGGPRCTPTVDGDLLYALGTDGDLVCLESATGKLRWHKNLVTDFGGNMMSHWKYSHSPVIDGGRLICTPGAPDAVMVALDKETGETIWKCAMPSIGSRGKDGAAYATAVVAEIDGVRQYITIVGRGAIGVAAETGKFLWGYNRVANGTANIPSPVVRGNQVFVTTSYKTGSALLKLTRSGDTFNVEEVYFLGPDQFENHHGGVVLVGDYLYGGDGQNKGTPVCLEFATGKIKWKEGPLGNRSAAVLYADGNVYFRYEDGLVALIEATPESFRVKGTLKAEVGKGAAWPYPVIHDGKLYLRHGDLLLCYDVKG